MKPYHFFSLTLSTLALAGVTAARAARLEIGPTGGWRFGGTLQDAKGESRTVEPSGSWGAVADVYFSDTGALELLWTRQETEVRSGDLLDRPVPLTFDHYQIGGLKAYEGDRFRPFLAGLLGWTHVKSGDRSVDRFSMTMGGGAKYYLSRRVGVRADLRAHLVVGDGSTAVSVGPAGGTVSFSGDAFLQGDVSGGVFLLFGAADPPSAPRPASLRGIPD